MRCTLQGLLLLSPPVIDSVIEAMLPRKTHPSQQSNVKSSLEAWSGVTVRAGFYRFIRLSSLIDLWTVLSCADKWRTAVYRQNTWDFKRDQCFSPAAPNSIFYRCVLIHCGISMHINAYVLTQDAMRLQALTSVTHQESGGLSRLHQCVCVLPFYPPNHLVCEGIQQRKSATFPMWFTS